MASLNLKVIGLLFKLFITLLQEMKTPRKALRNSLTILVIFTQLITNHSWMLNHFKNSKTPLNSQLMKGLFKELLNQLNSEMKEIMEMHKLKD
jgi:hypothetical protein